MKTVNRGFISITPTPLFIAWALKYSDEVQFFTNNPEPSIYLVEDDFWEDSKVIEIYYKKISQQEFSSLCTKDEIIPIISSEEEFSLYFDLSLGTIVHDLLKENIERE
jgi:hypothetical protein